MSIEANVNGQDLDRLQSMLNRLGNPDRQTLMEKLAFEGENQTKRRIAEEKTGPDGQRWPQWSDDYAARRKSGHSLLQGEGGLLDSITADADEGSAEWGSNLEYAAIHQFGGTEGMAPGPAAIPPRPYVGLSDDNLASLQKIINDWMARRLEGSA